MTTRNEVIEEMAQVVEAHRYDDEFLNNCGLRREHRADLAQAIRALKTDEPQDDGLVELLGEYWRESRRYIYDKTPERREKVIARFEPRILAALRNPQDDGLRSRIKDIINAHVVECMKAVDAVQLIPRHPGPAADAILAALSGGSDEG